MSSATVAKDFPDWMGPMLIKELRQGMKARAFELTFIALQVVLVLVLSYHALLYAKHGEKFDPTGLHAIFWVIVAVQLLVITPLRALGGLSAERKANTLELIFMTGLTSWRIAFGKWASLMFQALLFVLAVLPYAFLRYFFGGVNLTEDLIALGCALLACGVLTAVTLAISGLPVFFRVGAMILAGFGAMAVFPGLIFGIAMRGTMMSFGFGLSFGGYWALFVYDVMLIGWAALACSAATIAPLAENHAMRQRLIALAALLPVPVLMMVDAFAATIIGQVVFFGILAMVVSWVHLSIAPPELRVQVEPFSKRGPIGFAGGLFFQPGWPSAVLFLVLAQLLMIGVATAIHFPGADERGAFCTVFLMAGAALLTPVIIWRWVMKRSKFVLVWQALILVAGGGLMLMVEGLWPNATHLRPSLSMGDHVWAAAFPPFGFWAMLDGGLTNGNETAWLYASAWMFDGQAALLLVMSLGYWKRLFGFHREIRKARKQPVIMDGVPA